jgi:hypothetical protein
MSQAANRDQMSKRRVVLTVPGMEAVVVQRDVPYRVTDAGALTLDVYYPPDFTTGVPRPAVIIVTGFSDLGAARMLGVTFKETGWFVSWAQLVAASGLVAITYTNSQPGDVHELLQHVRQNAVSLGVDVNAVAVLACSGHGPTALSVLMQYGRDGLSCAVLVYPYTLDLDGASHVAGAAKQFGFVTAAARKSVDDLPREVSLLVVRAGRDQMPGLNQALDSFVTASLAANLPVTLVNHASGPHAFDLFDDSETARGILKQMLAFLRSHLSPRALP